MGIISKVADASAQKGAASVARGTAKAGQTDQKNDQLPPGVPKESATDVMKHSWDGLKKQMSDPLGIDHMKKAKAADDAAKKANLDSTHRSSLSDVGTVAGQQVDQLGKDLENISKAKGALQTVGAVFATLTSLEQLISAPFAAIPFPAFPAVRILDMDIGLPHAHSHPPNLIPPAPPVPLPSTGPVIPIPYVSGANKVLINAMPAARCGDMGLGIWCGGFVPLYEIFLGSASVWIEGARAARLAIDITNHCIFSARPGPKDPPLGCFQGVTVSASPNVMIGGIPMPSLTSMAMGAAFKAAFKLGGKAAKFLGNTKWGKPVAEALGKAGRRAKAKWNKAWWKKSVKEGIEKSNMAKGHGEQISKVATDTDQILMFQTVNPQAKGHIEKGAATKGMDVHGKSDGNGFIPMDQSKSPKAVAADKADPGFIARENQNLQDSLKKIDPETGKPMYTTVPGPDGNPVLAKNTPNGPAPVTSDYDMLAVGSKEPAQAPVWNKEKGNITPNQEKTLDKINDAVDHPGGNVVHHGPENQYSGKGPPKDGPKYPITSYEPDGSVKTLENDKQLKDYINQKKGEGYNGLDPDPSWGWEKGPDGKYK